MKRKTIKAHRLIFLSAIFLFANFYYGMAVVIKDELGTEKFSSSVENPYSAFNLTRNEIAAIERKFKKMTLKEKCAQMVFPNANAHFMNADSKQYRRLIHLVKELKVGGLIFFEGNILDQVILTNKLQEMCKIPLLIASDYERGLGMRLKDAVEFPYSMAVAAANDTELTYQMGRIISLEAKVIGVSQNFAPIVDLNNNADNPIINIRAYSENKDITINQTLAFINGSNEEKILTTLKHFPGHGATNFDSHKELPLLDHSKLEFEEEDLIPFEDAIKDGAKSVMIGHLDVPAFESTPNLPATLSKSIVTKLLKDELGFKGLIVTDAMNMQSITNSYSNGSAIVAAVNAGNDCILFPENADEAVNAIYRAVRKHKLGLARINYSVKKILAAKEWLKLDKNKKIDPDKVEQFINKKSHFRLAQEIADKSITLVKNDNGLIPISSKNYINPVCIILSNSKIPLEYSFTDLLKEELPPLKTFSFSRQINNGELYNCLDTAANSDLIIVPIINKSRTTLNSIGLTDDQVDFINKIEKLNKPMIFMNLGNPYVLSQIPRIPVYLCSYGDPLVSQKAIVNAVFGNIDITGRLPVTIPNTNYKLGDGIQITKNILHMPKGDIDSSYDFNEVDSIMSEGITEPVFPGGVLCIGYKGKLIYKKAFGRFTYDTSSDRMTSNAIFDLASLSKVIGTTTAAMILFDQGKLSLDKKVMDYLPDFGNNGKEKITIRNLLLHNSGLPAFIPFYKSYSSSREVITSIMNMRPEYSVGSKYIYSDLGMIVLQKVIEKISGLSLDKYLEVNVFDPLNMKNTMYNPLPELRNKCVPTEIDNYWRMRLLQGEVHDETASLLGGVSGNAGLFSTAGDLAVFLQMMLQDGKYDSLQIINPSTVKEWTKKQSDKSERGLGWDTKSEKNSSAGNLFSMDSFGHTGFTGTSVWVDKDRDLFVILLTNRIYPSRNNIKINRFRPEIQDAIIRAVDY
jgi:beta-N-acetylhexosaminidase